MPTLYLIRGAPGSGKSTLAEAIAAETGAAWYEADMWHIAADGEYRWTPENVKPAHAECQASARAALESGADVVVANTFTKLWELDAYLAMPFDSLRIIHCTGGHQNVHGVPDATVERMRENYQPTTTEIHAREHKRAESRPYGWTEDEERAVLGAAAWRERETAAALAALSDSRGPQVAAAYLSALAKMRRAVEGE